MVNSVLLDFFENPTRVPADPEIQVADGSTYEARISAIQGGGQVVMLHETTPLHEVNRKKSEFVLTVAHDLRSPLTAILSYVELLARTGNLNEQQAELTSQLKDGVGQVTNLINDLLEMSRVEAGMDTHNEPIQIQDVIDNALSALKSRAELKKQHLHKTFARKRMQVMANPARLRQVFTNLVDNAIKYTPEGGEVKVTLTGEGGQVMCSISDSGIGIPVEAQSRIFDKFYRAPTVLDTYEGTGLGLSIVKSIVESYDGRIWVDSAPGKGSTFTVVIPSYPPE
jgi:signal transduction histidine kinase